MAERKRVVKSSIAGTLATFESAKQVLVSPLDLSEREQCLFEDITGSREVSTWTKSDLFNAASLAKCRRRVEELNLVLDDQGYTLTNPRGTPISNPIFSSLTQLMSQMAMLNRLLGLSSSARGLNEESQQKRNAADARAREIIGKASEEDLLA